jgi:aryl-phospho-beta-D-glucosidase BglC (GH1 family)
MPTAAKLPRWRGFSLIEQAPYLDKPRPYELWDFDFMAEHGFDFVRLAVGHRHFMPTPGVFDERGIAEIDRAIGWSRERKIHVNLDQHAAPGYNAFANPRLTTLWEDGAAGDDARRQFAEVWRALARRYKGIPANELSFNLLNEPYGGATAAQYVRVAEPVVAAIRAEDPARVIIADGLAWARKPVPELTRLGVAQSRHMYEPSQLAEYKAPSVEGSDKWAVPTWPLQPMPTPYLAGSSHKDFQSPLVLRADFAAGAEVRITVDTVSHGVELVVRADGKEILRKTFTPGPGAGEWKSSTPRPQSNDYTALYDRPYAATLAAAAKEISFEVTTGDWLTFSEIRIRPLASGELSLRPGSSQYGVKQATYTVDARGTATQVGGHALDKDDLWQTEIAPWKALADGGVGVHVGEFGAYRFTPHDVTLRWMADVLDLFRRAGFGWALWNLRGGHGPVDSDRADVTYESYKGHRLDRKMLELLKTG